VTHRSIYAVDIGSTRLSRNSTRAFAWACVGKVPLEQGVRCSSDIDRLAKEIEQDLREGYSVALGFEAPLFIPVPMESERLSRGRDGDGDRAWAAPAGASVATLGLHQSAWLLRHLAKTCSRTACLLLDYSQWPPQGDSPVLFLWEAFVSGNARDEDHRRDAASAATYFLAHEANLSAKVACRADNPISLIGAAALWAGWSEDLSLLHDEVLVLRPPQRFKGELCIV
jgi:hypothetical protein